MATQSKSQKDRAEGVKRQLNGEAAPEEANPESLVGATDGSVGREPPKHTGESLGRRGEDQAKHSKEAGRHDEGSDEAGRPVGSSSERDKTGI